MAVFQKATQQLLGSARPPQTLWVVHTPFTRAMCEPLDAEHIDLGDHEDWLLAADDDTLALFKVRGPRMTADDLTFRVARDAATATYRDVGELTRRRVFSIADPGSALWVAVGAPLRPSGAPTGPTAAFTELIAPR